MSGVEVSVMVMRLSGGVADYFVQFKCDGRTTTPHVFRDRYKAEYHVDHYRWFFEGGEEPDLMAYDETSHPNYTQEELEEMVQKRFDKNQNM